MNWLDAVLMGIIEGLTEFLPVSSTGHLILLGDRLGQNSPAAKTLEIVIQLGAVLAVCVYYRERLARLIKGLIARDPAALRLTFALGLAFVPAAVIGLLTHKAIKELLFHPAPVAGALIVGGVLMIAVDVGRKRRGKPGDDGLEQVSLKRALAIGIGQCLSLWPGSSRSMTTIVAAEISGLTPSTAADFSFLLAIPTLGAATVYDLVKNYKTLASTPGALNALAIGLVVSFVVALAVIAAFLRYLKRFGLAPFGVYRIALGVIVLLTLGASGNAPSNGSGALNASTAASATAAATTAGSTAAPQ
ncbi:MAG: undecaprenyl-diphosphate phosphatase [Polyangiaceae bacterium]|nr:undecaprenyl-diphosphate phosphatase [Polyangiaceae bacterium]